MNLILDPDSFLIDRSRLFLYYDKFRYRAKIHVDNIQYFRYVKSVKKMNEQLRYVSNLRSFGLHINDVSEVRRFVEWIELDSYSKDQFSYRTSTNCVDVYSNDVEILQDAIQAISSEKHTIKYQLYRATENPKLDRTKIYLVNPKYKYRVYFKWDKKSSEQIQEVIEFINKHNISCSKSFKDWIQNQDWTSSYYYLWENFFIEFDEEIIITLMSLKFENVFGKIRNIEKR
jgi:hypothetical protein